MNDQEFRLHFVEGFEEGDRLCTPIAQVELGNSGKFGLRVAINPAIDGGKYTNSRVDFLVLVPFFAGTNLFPITEWPFHVRVFVPMVDHPETLDRFESDQLYMIAFGTLHQTTTS